MIPENFAAAFRIARRKKNLTLLDVSELTGIAKPICKMIENGGFLLTVRRWTLCARAWIFRGRQMSPMIRRTIDLHFLYARVAIAPRALSCVRIDAYAQATFRRLLSGAKLPRIEALKTEGREFAAKKNAAYGKYRAARKDMQEVVTVKANIDHLLGLTDKQKNKEQER